MADPAPFTRLTAPDPATNRVIQDLYDKLSRAQSAIQTLTSQVATLQAQVKSLLP